MNIKSSKNIGFIPIRSGSKSIPNKNLRLLGGKPLYRWVLDEAVLSNLDEIYVYHDYDHNIIYNTFSNNKKVKFISRNKEDAKDESSTEEAILNFINDQKISLDSNLFLLQATSPLTKKEDINNCIKILHNYKSVLSCCNIKRFTWNYNNRKSNYNIFNRPRRQEYEGILIENGAIYGQSVKNIIKYKNRISKRPYLYVMDEKTFFEVDELIDFYILEKIIEKNKF